MMMFRFFTSNFFRNKTKLWIVPGKIFKSFSSEKSTKIFDQLSIRGLLCSHFPQSADINDVLSRKQTIYAGFDATAKSLHVGNLLVLISLFHLVQHGHRIIVLVGDSTARIGDPAGKSVERTVLDDDLVESNANGIERDIVRIFNNFKKHFSKKPIDDRELIICRNSTWYQNMNVIDFIGKYARQLRMGDMLSKTSIRERLESPGGLNFAEFSYQTFQAYDWYYLYRKYQCKVQLGGVDQTVNIHNGYTLIKKLGHEYSYGLFIPLITDEKGNKIGKSEKKSVIFLDPTCTTPFGLYQYFMRIPDKDIGRLLRLFSFRPISEIEAMIQNQMKTGKPWHLQKKLAEEMTLLVHDESGLAKAEKITRALFDKNLEQLGTLNEQEIRDVFDDINIYQLEFEPEKTTVLNLAMKTEFFNSELNAIKTIDEGGFYVNYQRETDPGRIISEQDQHILKNGITIVSLGKRNHRLIRWL